MRFPRGASVFLFICVAAVVLRAVTVDATGDIVLRAADAPVIQGEWRIVPDATAAGGSRLGNPDRGAPKVAPVLAAPTSYFELSFSADAATPYHLWLRGRAQGDDVRNDSVYVQFSDSVKANGAATLRIGSTSGTAVVLEDCSDCGVSGWGWQDNRYGGLAGPIYFASSGTHTIRVQIREDGLSIDQIVLSPAAYLTTPPGPPTNDSTVLTGGGAPSDTDPLRGPYLQQVLDRSATIVWASREPGLAAVVVGSRTFAATSRFFGASMTGVEDYFQHEAVVTGLSPATDYSYQLLLGGTAMASGTGQLKTAPATGSGRVRFIAFGDSGTGSPEQSALASRMSGDGFDLALHAGDIAYGNSGGTGSASHATYDAWFFDVYGSWLRRRPFFPSMGNHDARPDNNWGAAYLNLFALPPHGGEGTYPEHAERYYSFDYGPVHFVALDTELAFQDPSRRAAQLAWLEADLTAAASQPWKVAFFHRPPYNAGSVHGSDLAVRAAFAPIFETHGVQLSVSAHEHAYERSVPWRESANAANQAVTYLVTGGGGGPLYPAGRAAWTAASASEHHYVRVTVEGCVATIEAIRLSGALLDAQVLDRCAQASDAAPPVVDFVSLASGMTVSGLTPVDAYATDDVRVEKVDLMIDGRLHGSDAVAPYEFSWNAGEAAPGTHTLELRAYDIAGRRSTRAVTVSVVASGGESPGLPDGWLSQDIGAVGIPGSVAHAAGSFTVSAAGADIWGTADAFRYTYRPLSADGVIVARVASMSGTEPWMKAGVMIRASTAPGAPHAAMFVSLSKGLAFQRRSVEGGLSMHTAGPALPAPYWLKLERSGHIFTASVSSDGVAWSVVGGADIPMPGTVLVGLAVTSHTSAALATAVLDSVKVTTSSVGSSGWRSDDVGAVGVAGSASDAAGTFTVRGAGADVWGTVDAFHYLSRTLSGDGAVVARVQGVEGTHAWTKVGVMMRAGLDAASPHGFMLVSAAKGLAFQRRTVPGGVTAHTAATSATARWVKLTRTGNVIIASVSADGVVWTEVGRDTFAFNGAPIRVGLAVTSHDAAQLATGIFDNVSLTLAP